MPVIQIQTDIPSLERDRLNRELNYAVDRLASAQSSMIAELRSAFSQVTTDDIDDITHGGVECWQAELNRIRFQIITINRSLFDTVWTD